MNTRVNCQLEDRAFKKAFRKWKRVCGAPDPCAKSLYPFWRLEFFETKITIAKSRCMLPPEETILLLYDMTFMSSTDTCCVLGRYGIYCNAKLDDNTAVKWRTEPLLESASQLTSSRAPLRRTNTLNRLAGWIRRVPDAEDCGNNEAYFIPWTDFFSAQLLSREGRKICLNGRQILDGYNHCKLFFSLLYFLFQHFSTSYPFNFLLFKPQLPPSELILTAHDLMQLMKDAKLNSGKRLRTFEQLSHKQKDFFSYIPCFQNEVIHFVYKHKHESSVITHRGIYSVMGSASGSNCSAQLCPSRGGADDEVDFYSWKEILEEARFIMKTGDSVYINDKPFTVCNKKLFLLLTEVHIFLGKKYQEKVASPPKYDDLSLFINKQMEVSEQTATNSTCSLILLADKRDYTEVEPEPEGTSIIFEDLSCELPPSYSPSSVRRSPCATRRNTQPLHICPSPPPYHQV